MRFSFRPKTDPYCQAQYAFCPLARPYQFCRTMTPSKSSDYKPRFGNLNMETSWDTFEADARRRGVQEHTDRQELHSRMNGFGNTFNKVAEWVKRDNETGIYYETWDGPGRPGKGGTVVVRVLRLFGILS
ncbi:Ceroid-lipofuscinosis neuronal protein 5 homolog [Apodemus speciosus]|uniref:Bis(monoacylglycero)phosphate synthase CLN5 n=1 Tax=Apodemus speciosus TaxID=105296 RepID=A0ABQ0FIS3_APOSI